MAVAVWDQGLRAGGDLPVAGRLAEVVACLERSGRALLVAPPGTGKTTLVPLALARALAAGAAEGAVVVAQPRRLAARAAAARMAALTGTAVGDVVGVTVRGERRVSARTRVEVVTTGVLVNRLLRDPELPGVAAVVLDECHERHLDADLALAFAVDVRAALREDLWLLATSATPDVSVLTTALAPAGAGPVPVLEVSAPTHPVEMRWAPPPAPPQHAGGRNQVDPGFLDHVAAVAVAAHEERRGDVLVFVPGLREIEHVAAAVRAGAADVDVRVLHGGLPAGVQDAVLRPGEHPRVIVSSAVAESSLTVPGVRVVVDAGLSRQSEHDPGRGLARLVTTRVSRASAAQRTGRAGREAPGVGIRCWAATDHHRLPDHPQAEIMIGDLAPAALALAAWGLPDGSGLALPEPPPAGRLAAARAVLGALGAVDADGRPTPRGRAHLRLGVHPRLGRALLDAAPFVGVAAAAEATAALDDEVAGARGLRAGDDLAAAVRRLRRGEAPGEVVRRWRQETQRLSAAAASLPGTGDGGARPSSLDAVGLVAALAYPDRIARRREEADSYVMTSGPQVELAAGSALEGSPWIVVVDAVPRGSGLHCRTAVAIDEAVALQAASALHETRVSAVWADGDVRARRRRSLGAIVLEDVPAEVEPALRAAAVADGLRRDGLGLLRWSDAATAFRQRLAAAHAWRPQRWPAVDDDALLADLQWLEPALGRCRSRADLARIDVLACLKGLLPWDATVTGPGSLAEAVPESLQVPSGRRVRVDWSDPLRPVLAVKLQECFGWARGPRVLGGDVGVVLHLLSPAGAPLAVTGDLESFWESAYPQVRAQMRGRYPKHPWPEDPWRAPATARTAAALRRAGP
ncbi:MAG: ATP-dependent helicase HrpB [Kineosporiaceae bacterium]